MARSLMLKVRARAAARRASRYHRRRSHGAEIAELEKTERKLEKVADEIMQEVEEIEEAKGEIAAKDHQFGWIRGKLTLIALQDFVGAIFGAVFFAVTQEVWDLAIRMSTWGTIGIVLISFISAYALIFFSRRRHYISERIYHTSLLRAVEVYTMSIIASLIFVMLLGLASEPTTILKTTALMALPAVISASTADLLFF